MAKRITCIIEDHKNPLGVEYYIIKIPTHKKKIYTLSNLCIAYIRKNIKKYKTYKEILPRDLVEKIDNVTPRIIYAV